MEPMPTPADHPPLLVTCLCAQWCGTCRDYRVLFDSLQTVFPQARFVWVDVEDQADLVEPMDVEDFPTLLLVWQGEARFFGTLTPHLETVRRLIQSQLDAPGRALADPAVQALAGRLLSGV